MISWVLLDTVHTPGGGKELRLYRHDKDFSIRVGTVELMNSRAHGSEEDLAELACEAMMEQARPRVMIGGLGMGFTLRAALDRLSPQAQVVVAELVPAVVAWNRGPLAGLAGNPLADKRVSVHEGDVAKLIKAGRRQYHAILLDVDNGPRGLSDTGNDGLYHLRGLYAAFAALRPGGVLAIWSAGPDVVFTRRLRMVGFEVEEVRVRARGGRKGAHHLILLARR